MNDMDIESRIIESGVPRMYGDLNLFDKSEPFGETGNSVKKILLDCEKNNIPFPNTLIRNFNNYKIGYAIIKAYATAGRIDSLAVSLEDILAARDIVSNNDTYETQTGNRVFLTKIEEKPTTLFINDFVTHEPTEDNFNINLKLFTGYEYRYLNKFIKDRLENENLTTILYSASSQVHHCWSKQLLQIMKKNINLKI